MPRRNKITIVVDDDVDLYDMEKVLWAIATRTQADEDVIVFPRVVATAMDPSVRKLRVGSALGIDATKPFGQLFPEMVTVPGADTVSLDDYLAATSQSVDFLKIDADGSEPFIFRGMQSLLASDRPLTMFVEFCPAHLRGVGTDPLDFLKTVHDARFDVSLISPAGIQCLPAFETLCTCDCVELLLVRS